MFSSHSPGTCYNGALWALCYSMQYLGIQSRFQTTLVHTPIFYICQKINVRSCNFRYLCLLLNQPATKNQLVPRAKCQPKLFNLLQFKNRRGQAVSSLLNCSHNKKLRPTFGVWQFVFSHMLMQRRKYVMPRFKYAYYLLG